DGAAAVEVQYDPLPVVVDPKKALEPGAPVLRTDKKDKKDNHIWHWEWGDKGATDRAFGEAAVTVKEDIYLPRIHVASIETCGCVAHFDKALDKLTVWMTTQPPHAIRTVFALLAGHVGLAAHKTRIKTLTDHDYTETTANPSNNPAGLYHVRTGSYDLKAAHVEVDGAYTKQPLVAIALRYSLRATEAVHTGERIVALMAHQLNTEP